MESITTKLKDKEEYDDSEKKEIVKEFKSSDKKIEKSSIYEAALKMEKELMDQE